MGSAADVIHLDLLLGRGVPIPAELLAKLAVAIGAASPSAADQIEQLRIRGAPAKGGPQIEAVGGKEAGIKLSLGGQAGAGAIAAKRLRHRRDEADLPGAVIEAPAL